MFVGFFSRLVDGFRSFSHSASVYTQQRMRGYIDKVRRPLSIKKNGNKTKKKRVGHVRQVKTANKPADNIEGDV